MRCRFSPPAIVLIAMFASCGDGIGASDSGSVVGAGTDANDGGTTSDGGSGAATGPRPTTSDGGEHGSDPGGLDEEGSEGPGGSDAGTDGADEPATEFYVAPTGDDTNPGTSEDQAWRTIKASLPKLEPGYTLYVRGGTYDEFIDHKSLPMGTDQSPIRVTNYPGERPVIRGHLRLQRPTHWIWDGVHVTRDPATSDAVGDLVHLRDGKHWIFRNNEVWGGHKYANVTIAGGVQYPGEPGDFVVQFNCVHDIAVTHTVPKFQDHNFYVNFGANAGAGGVIERNIIFKSPNGAGIKVGAGNKDSPHPTHVTIRYNTIYDGARSIVIAHGAAHTSFERNLFVKATGEVNAENPSMTALIYAYHLTGPGNTFKNNYGWDATKFLHVQPPATQTVENLGGNAFNEADPVLNASNGCAGYQPSNSAAKNYGRHAP